MNRTQKSTFNVLFYLKKSKLLKNGEAPIAMRITVKGVRAEILIKRSVKESLWNQAKECSKGKDYAAKELNHYLESTKARIYQIRREIEESDKELTVKVVRDKYYGRDKETLQNAKTICGIYSDHNEQCRALIGIEFSKSTVEKFDTSLSHLKTFISHKYRQNDLPLSQVDGEFIRGLDFFLKTEYKCQRNSAIKHLKNLKKVINIALSNDWIIKDPFRGITFSHEKTKIEYLNKKELQDIIDKKFRIQRVDQVRDIFVFCCFTGLAYVDVLNLTKDDITTDNDGSKWIIKNRHKTKTEFRVPLFKEPLDIINKYEDHPDCVKKNILLPVLTNQKMNAYLKEIADLCNINKPLTTHIARHTCATTVMLANNISLEIIQKILGHASIKSTQIYAKVMNSSIQREIQKVVNVFSSQSA